MKIVLVCPYALNVPGGVQAQAIGLAHQLRQWGHQVSVVGPAGARPGEVDVGRWVKVKANRSVGPIAFSLGVWPRVRKALAGADVVHIHEPFIPMVGWAALSCSSPKAVTFHADPSPGVQRLYRTGGPVLRGFLKGAAVSAVSRTAQRPLERFASDSQIIPNGLDVDFFDIARPRNPHQVAFVGRPEPRKGRDLLLAAWPIVRRQVSDAQLLVVGGGPEQNIDGVEFRGRVSEEEKRQALANSAVFCAPNRGGESFGITIAEAMAAGCAVAASDLPAFVDLLGGTGELFPTGNVVALAEVIIRLLTDPHLRIRRATASVARIKRFDWGKIALQYLELYSQAQSQPGR